MEVNIVRMLALCGLGAAIMAGCAKDAEEVHADLVGAPTPNTVVAISMSYTRAGAPFDKNVPFTDGAGTLVLLQRLNFFFSQPRFTDDTGDSVASFPSKYLLIDLDEGGLVRTVGELDGHLHMLHAGLGLDTAMNHTDPTMAPPPMNSSNLWWGWAAGYRFMTLEGKYDSNNSGTIDGNDFTFDYHIGMDTLYRRLDLEVHTDADMGGNVVIPLSLSIDTLFTGLDIATQPVVEVVNDISTGLMDRLPQAITHVE
jgi:hypothetical protein